MFIAAKDYIHYERLQSFFFGSAQATQLFCESEYKWYIVGAFYVLWLMFYWAARVAKTKASGVVALDA